MENENNLTKKTFFIEGMVCRSCEKLVTEKLLSMEGVKDVSVNYNSGRIAVEFDSDKIKFDAVRKAVEEEGYTYNEEGEKRKGRWLDYIAGTIGLFAVIFFLFSLLSNVKMPVISPDMGYGLLFILGLLTGFHCISMCGGFVLSYTAKDAQAGKSSYLSHVSYGAGKLISYTLIGAAFGLIGSLIVFTPFMRGIAGVIAGLFLLIFGLKMLDVFPILRRMSFRTPRLLEGLIGKESSPFTIGLLNGLMIACGPLQAIYIMAAGTGSALEGAKLLFVFALGTLPVMLGFGYLTSFVSMKLAHKLLKFSGIVVMVLGIIMLNRGLVLTGSGYDFSSVTGLESANTIEAANSNTQIKGDVQEIRMDVTRKGWEPAKFVLKKGIPVRWIINGKEITGCNNAIQVPKLGLNFKIKQGEQVIEFTPDEAGVIQWSCWMGMIQGVFIVKDDINLEDTAAVKQELDSVESPKAKGGCGCGGCSG